MDTTIFNALERRASDIHIETRDQEVAIKYRIDGVLHYAMLPIAKDWHSTIISRVKVMSELDIAERRTPQDGRFRVRYKNRLIDFRVSIMPTIHGEDAVLRVLDKESMSEKFAQLERMIFAEGAKQQAQEVSGDAVVCGGGPDRSSDRLAEAGSAPCRGRPLSRAPRPRRSPWRRRR